MSDWTAWRDASGNVIGGVQLPDVLAPLAENNAINTGEHPRDSTQKSIEAFQRGMRSWGISIARRENGFCVPGQVLDIIGGRKI